ncbi:MAG: serpin family protein [Planctomycetota bacterium]
MSNDPPPPAHDRIFDAYLTEALGGDAAPDQWQQILEQAANRGLLGADATGRSGPHGSRTRQPAAPGRPMTRDQSSPRPRRLVFVLTAAAVLLLGVALMLILQNQSRRVTPDSAGGTSDTGPIASNPANSTDHATDAQPDWPTYTSYAISVATDVNAINGSVADATNAMGFDMLTRLRKRDGDHNTMISPLSIAMALHMMLNGAEGRTAEEMRSALHLKGIGIDTVNASNQMLKAIAERSNKTVIRISNSAWVDAVTHLRQPFADVLHDSYGARIGPLTDAATINDWVSQQTEGMIPAVVNDSVVHNSRMILVNALYFAGTWFRRFDPKDTTPRDFLLSSGEKVKVPMMSLGHESFDFRFNDISTAVRLDFAGAGNVCIFVPAGTHTTDDVLAELQNTGWRSVDSQFQSEFDCFVDIPRMKIHWSGSLVDPLEAMGMREAFGDGAQFPGVSDRNLHLTGAEHTTMLAVDENGAVGAAATELPGLDSPSPSLTADRPFVLVVSDRRTGSILMIGVINDPR